MKDLSYLLILVLLSTSQFGNTQDCTCQNETEVTQQIQPSFQVSQYDEIIDGVNYGKLVQIGQYVQLQHTFRVRTSYTSVQADCPQGYRVGTLAEIQEINQYIVDNDLMDRFLEEADYRVNDPTTVYITTNFIENWVYDSFTIDPETQEITYATIHTYWNNSNDDNPENQKVFAKCLLLEESFGQVDFSSFVDEYKNQDYVECDYETLEVKENINVVSYQWELPNGDIVNTRSADIIAYKNDKKCGKYKLTIEKFGGFQVTFCKSFFSQTYQDESSSDSLINSAEDVTKVTIPNISARQNRGMHFTQGTAPLTPIPEGGAYLLYTENTDEQDLVVLILTNEGEVQHTIQLNNQGKAFDITATPFGFIYMARKEPHYAYLEAWNVAEDGTASRRWNKTIVNNGDAPDENTVVDQVDLGGGFGTSQMFNPHNGRLEYARGRLLCVFAHYNFFGYYDNGNRNVHTGDSAFTVNAEAGDDVQVAWGWATSHSLRQSSMYDGKDLYVSSLGDAYPQSIKTYKISDVDEELSTQGKHLPNPELIPGNGTGKACGRVGGTTKMTYNRHAMTYAQRPCDISFQGNPTQSSESRLAVAFFNDENFTEPLAVKKLTGGKWVNQVRSAKYGQNLVIGYSLLQEESRENFQGEVPLNASINENDEMHIMLINYNGTILKQFKMESSSMSAQEDWQTLSDGRVAWSFVNYSNELEFHFLPKTQQNMDEPNRLEQQCSTGVTQAKPEQQIPRDIKQQSNVSKEEKDSGLSGGAIAAIVICIILVVGASAGAGFFVYKRKLQSVGQITDNKTSIDEEKNGIKNDAANTNRKD